MRPTQDSQAANAVCVDSASAFFFVDEEQPHQEGLEGRERGSGQLVGHGLGKQGSSWGEAAGTAAR